MIAELGNYGLALALGLSIFLAILPLIGAQKGNITLMSLARPMTWECFWHSRFHSARFSIYLP
ncbi:cytochrome c-type biogenesis protein CcmF [Actinobacillus equuli]|nr:cytochrome c-type biogenesis protein CcmF [Actinobacillus equuli]